MKLKPFFAEFFATFGFVFIGVLSVVAASQTGSTLGQIGPALAHGIALAVMVSATIHISGGQVNPAITLAVWLGNKISFLQAIVNIVGQVFGALLAVRVLTWALDALPMDNVAYGIPAVAQDMGRYQAMALEAVFTFFLALAVFSTVVDRRAAKVGGLYVGLTAATAGLALGPFTGACLNPARYLGPAIMSQNYAEIIVYTAGPILGAAIAALVYTYGFGKEDPVAEA